MSGPEIYDGQAIENLLPRSMSYEATGNLNIAMESHGRLSDEEDTMLNGLERC